MAKNQGGTDTARSKKISTQTKKKSKIASGGAARIVAVNDEELEAVVVLSNSTESENADVSEAEGRGIEFISEEKVSDTEGEEDEIEEKKVDNGGIRFLYDEKAGDTDEENAEAKSNGYDNQRGKGKKVEKNSATKRRGDGKEKQSVVKKAKNNAGTSQKAKEEKNSKARPKENGDAAANKAKVDVHQEKKIKEMKNGEAKKKKEQVLKKAKSSSNPADSSNTLAKDIKQKKNRVGESKGSTKNTPKEENPNENSSGQSGKNRDEEKMQKRKERLEEDEEVRGKVAKKVKVGSGGDKSQPSKEKKLDSKTKKKGKLEEEEDVEGKGTVVAKKVKSIGQTGRMGKDIMEVNINKQMKKVETEKKDNKKVKGSSGNKSQPGKEKKEESKAKKKAKLDEEGRGTVVAKKVKSNGQASRNSKDIVDDNISKPMKAVETEKQDNKKLKGSSGDKSQPSKGKKEESKAKKKGKLEEEDEEGRETFVAKNVKSDGQASRISKDIMDDNISKQMKKAETEKQDIQNAKNDDNGAKRAADANRKVNNIVAENMQTKEEDDDGEVEEDVKCESILYNFPMTRVSRIIKSENSNAKLSQEATFVINKATEKFLELFCKEAYACAFLDRKLHVGYNHLSSVVCKRKRFEFLSDSVPEKIKAEQALAVAENVG